MERSSSKSRSASTFLSGDKDKHDVDGSLLCEFVMDVGKKLAELKKKFRKPDEEVKTLKSRLDRSDAPEF